MPELPEVETIKSDLGLHLKDRSIANLKISDPFAITGISPRGRPRRNVSVKEFASHVRGKSFAEFERRGKYLITEFSDGSALIFHLRMTGQLIVSKEEPHPSPALARIAFTLDDGGSLLYFDRRRFGEVLYSRDWRNEKCIRSLGMEPLNGSLNAQVLKGLFSGRKTAIHSALLNQNLVAGLGNIYAAESLFLSGIKPTRRAGSLSISQLSSLSESIRKVLLESIKNRGYSMTTYVDALGKKGRSQMFTSVYGRDGSPCNSCGAILLKKVISGRGVVFCPHCQT